MPNKSIGNEWLELAKHNLDAASRRIKTKGERQKDKKIASLRSQ